MKKASNKPDRQTRYDVFLRDGRAPVVFQQVQDETRRRSKSVRGPG